MLTFVYRQYLFYYFLTLIVCIYFSLKVILFKKPFFFDVQIFVWTFAVLDWSKSFCKIRRSEDLSDRKLNWVDCFQIKIEL